MIRHAGSLLLLLLLLLPCLLLNHVLLRRHAGHTLRILLHHHAGEPYVGLLVHLREWVCVDLLLLGLVGVGWLLHRGGREGEALALTIVDLLRCRGPSTVSVLILLLQVWEIVILDLNLRIHLLGSLLIYMLGALHVCIGRRVTGAIVGRILHLVRNLETRSRISVSHGACLSPPGVQKVRGPLLSVSHSFPSAPLCVRLGGCLQAFMRDGYSQGRSPRP